MLRFGRIMPAKAEARPNVSAWKNADRARNRLVARGIFPLLSFLCCLAAGILATRSIRAEENGVLAGSGPSLTTLSLNLALLSSHSLLGAERLIQLPFDARFSASLKDLASEKENGSTLPKSLLRKPLVWFKEVPRARLRPGFGPFFEGETVEPLRCNGAGVEDSRYLFVKLSFRF